MDYYVPRHERYAGISRLASAQQAGDSLPISPLTGAVRDIDDFLAAQISLLPR
jgi:hypothetical protein